jgi:hypothetical protein
MIPRLLLALIALLPCAAYAQSGDSTTWEDRVRLDILYGPSFRLGGTEAPKGSILGPAFAPSSLGRWSVGASYSPFARLFAAIGYSQVKGDNDDDGAYDRLFEESNPGYLILKQEWRVKEASLITLGLEYQIPVSFLLIEPGVAVGISRSSMAESKVIMKEDGGNIYRREDIRLSSVAATQLIPSLTIRAIADTKKGDGSPSSLHFGLLMRLQYIRSSFSIPRSTTESIPPEPAETTMETIPFTYESLYLGFGITLAFGW